MNCCDYIESINPGLYDNEYTNWFNVTFEELTGHSIVPKDETMELMQYNFTIEFKTEVDITAFILRWR